MSCRALVAASSMWPRPRPSAACGAASRSLSLLGWTITVVTLLQRAAADAESCRTKRVLIVGAGPGGASAAYFLAHGAASTALNLTIYDKQHRVGGRVLDVLLNDTVLGTQHRAELGASIFLQGNAILYNASRDFGLEFTLRGRESPAHARLYAGEVDFAVRSQAAGRAMGHEITISRPCNTTATHAVYDGAAVVFAPPSRFTLFALLWRYGWSLLRGRRLGAEALRRFVRVYTSDAGFATPRDLIEFLGWDEYAETSAAHFFGSRRVSARFSEELIQGVCRTNYAQDLAAVNAVAALVGVIPSPALTVAVGNARIFERMVAFSGAAICFDAAVTAVARDIMGGGYRVTTRDGEAETFDVVIVAAPLTPGDVDFVPPLSPPSLPLRYVHLHVTVVLGTVRAAHFGVSLAAFPRYFMTLPSCTRFTSFSTLKRLPTSANASDTTWGGRGVFKMFSFEQVDEEELGKLFVEREQLVTKVWEAPGTYPYLPPRGPKDEQLSSFVLDEHKDADGGVYGLYFLNGFEGVMSSMESQSVAGRNVANLVRKRLGLH